ncbi:cytokine receptor family member b4 [Xenentodon cancila]
MLSIVFLLFWVLRCSAAEAVVPPPEDLTVITLNTDYTLSWDWNWESESDVTFTAEFVAKFKLRRKNPPNWTTACEKITQRSCDLTAFNLYYQGLYSLRVRANVNGHHSDWASKDFCPDKDAAIGPPSKVVLSVAGSHLDVFITEPLTSTNSSMKEKLPDIYYNFLYWERDEDKQVGLNLQDLKMHTLSSSATMVTLPNLGSWTWYCVRVQTLHDFYNRSSSFTTPHCMQTEGPIPWWQISLFFLGSLLICFICVALSMMCWFWCFKSCRDFFFPQLPTFLKTYFLDSTISNSSHLVLSDSETESLYDHMIICPNQVVLEIPNPTAEDSAPPSSNLDPDSSSLHSRQGSSSSSSSSSSRSRDSGVYSSGGTSGTHQIFTDIGDGCGVSYHLQHMKTEVVEVELKHPPDVADEGVVDV